MFAGLCLLVAAASPLAFALLGVVFVGLAIGDRWDSNALRWGLAVLAAVGTLLVVTDRVFATRSHDPFPLTAYLTALACSAGLAALSWRVRDARALRVGALVNAAACTAAFAVTSNVGEGITRLDYVALPVALLAFGLRRWRPRGLVALGVFIAGYWNVAPLVASFAIGVGDPSATASFWQPAVPAGGWFRQDDFPQNEPLYDPLTASSYAAWLRSLGRPLPARGSQLAVLARVERLLEPRERRDAASRRTARRHGPADILAHAFARPRCRDRRR